ncbi:MAG: hypothetical protein NUW01_04380 [Gemmatimonadaceae bacterium]|nr:hypothetical protein [Gemmatimonadaceae bacterium]
MRGYSVAIAALALGVESKWLDNLLSHNRVSGVTQARQGVPRRLGPGALHVIATVHRLNRELQIPVGAALRLAHALWDYTQTSDQLDAATVRTGELELRLDRAEVRARVAAAVAEALEMAPRTKRGRPPKRDRATTRPR